MFAFFFFLVSSAQAFEPEVVHSQFLPTFVLFPHGPDGPLPDEDYEFKGKSTANWLAKVGLIAMIGGGVTGVRALKAPSASELRKSRSITSASLIGGGMGLILIERVR